MELTAQAEIGLGRRRNKRLPLHIPVVVCRRVNGQSLIIEQTNTLVVNAYGALITLASRLELDGTILLVNKGTQQQQDCRVAYVSLDVDGKWNVGLAFMRPAPNFWPAYFPLIDLEPLSH